MGADATDGTERGEIEHADRGATGEIGAPNGFGPEMLLDGCQYNIQILFIKCNNF